MSLSLSPGGILARLDELKKWQQIQQERFAKQMAKDAPLDLDLISPIPKRNSSLQSEIEGVAPLSASEDRKKEHVNNIEVLKNCSAEVIDETQKIIKKPFLRRGTGLVKYRMTLKDTKPPSRPPPCISKSKSMREAVEAKKSALIKKHAPLPRPKSPPVPVVQKLQPKSTRNPVSKENLNSQTQASVRSTSPNKKGDYKVTESDDKEKIANVPKLENPKLNFSFKPKGLWTNVSEMQKPKDLTPVEEEEESIISQINRIVNKQAEVGTVKSANAQGTRKCQIPASPQFNINDLGGDDTFLAEIQKFFLQQQNALGLNPKANEFETPVNPFQKPTSKNAAITSTVEQPPPEINHSERELRVFEALEEKALQSSFCSTNSSVAYLLSMQSTPQKSQYKNAAAASPSSSVTSDDVKEDETKGNFEDDNHWSTTEVESDDDSENLSTLRGRVLIVVDAETMTDRVPETTADEELAKKLRALEGDVQVFRSENSRLAKTKMEMEKEMRELRKQKTDMEDEKRRVESYLEEEKRKLSKDKMVFEKYVKELKNKPSKKEREEIAMLRNDLAAAKEELKLKESRHGAAQARLRTQLKQLEKDKGALMAENEALRMQNGKLMAQQKLVRPMTDTKVIHEINKKLTKLTQDKTVLEKRSEPPGRISSANNANKSVKINFSTSANNTLGNRSAFSNESARHVEDDSETDEEESEDNETIGNFSDAEAETRRSGKPLEKLPVVYARQISHPLMQSSSSEKILDVERFPPAYDYLSSSGKKTNVAQENNRNLLNFTESSTTLKSVSTDTVERDYEQMIRSLSEQDSAAPLNYTLEENHKKGRKERYLKDGAQEIVYSNGNVKTISPDGNLIKMVYYNGDVKETDLRSGTINYLYAESKICHVTHPDGLEVLNFPDGKVEKRYKDGSLEFVSPDGFIRNVDADGKEQISYPDGTNVSISGNGEKVVKLPNGQRIVHTKEHKRREYPDGTVNILYPDGLLETRYKNGRIRLKDANGRCLMDSHPNGAE